VEAAEYPDPVDPIILKTEVEAAEYPDPVDPIILKTEVEAAEYPDPVDPIIVKTEVEYPVQFNNFDSSESGPLNIQFSTPFDESEISDPDPDSSIYKSAAPLPFNTIDSNAPVPTVNTNSDNAISCDGDTTMMNHPLILPDGGGDEFFIRTKPKLSVQEPSPSTALKRSNSCNPTTFEVCSTQPKIQKVDTFTNYKTHQNLES
jgi:hypothetical protein